MSTPLRRRREEPDRARRDAQQTAADALSETVRLRRALDALTSAIVIYDARGQLVLRNRKHAELDTNRHVSALLAACVDKLVATAQKGEPANQTLELHGPPARIFDITTVPLGTSELPLGSIATVDDVSEQRRLEASRRDLAANVSHELRTPIGALSVLAEALVEEDDPDIVRRLAQHIMAETDRVGRLLENLLDLSRIEGEIGVVTTSVDIVAMVSTAAERVVALASKRDIKILATAPEAGIFVLGEERQLLSALLSLLDNAINYSEPGSMVELRSGVDRKSVVVTVRDQGIGIPAKHLERIFERFYRVDRSRNSGTGAGLGLSIVRHVMANHGGSVEVISREGEGSTFTLRLPKAPR